MTEKKISEGKICFKCGEEKPLTEFYKNKGMADGRVNKCKDCTKISVSENYRKNRSHYAEYEQKRWRDSKRRAKAVEYQRNTRKQNLTKYKATNAVNNALRDGRLTKKPCEMCGAEDSQAHHWDYNKPLEVQWLCRACHLMMHEKQAYEFENIEAGEAEENT